MQIRYTVIEGGKQTCLPQSRLRSASVNPRSHAFCGILLVKPDEDEDKGLSNLD